MTFDLRDKLRPHIEKIGQAQLARLSGIPQPSISAWLSGTRGLPFERQVELAEACGLKVTIKIVKMARG